MEPEVNLVKDNTKKTKKVFETKCYHCKEKEKLTTDDGLSFDLPFAYVEVKKNKDLLKECKAYVKESEEKYKNAKKILRIIKICFRNIWFEFLFSYFKKIIYFKRCNY